jgi:molecular chaperone GrpE
VTERRNGMTEEEQGPVVRDKRRIDPETGELREPAEPAPAAPAASGDGVVPEAGPPAEEDETARQLAERTADLQRLQAEYANYRRRVERDREANREAVVANVLANLLPILDDIGRARDHGELEGGFKSVGEALEQTVERLGLVRFGAAGDAFDPMVHEALTHTHSAEVSEPTCVEVFQPGYRIGDRVVRPARVAVADPESE